jgi:hypothetical protein
LSIASESTYESTYLQESDPALTLLYVRQAGELLSGAAQSEMVQFLPALHGSVQMPMGEDSVFNPQFAVSGPAVQL